MTPEQKEQLWAFLQNANIPLLSEDIVCMLSHFDGTGDENGSEPKIYPHRIEYRKNGKLHRDGDRPAVIYAVGGKEWWVNGKLYRDGDRPAFIGADGSKVWYVNDKRHRDGDRPAVIWADGSKEWWVNGRMVRGW